MSLDSLQYLPVDQWYKLKDVLKKDWPRCISGFTALDTMEGIIKLGYDFSFKVYCPYGDVYSGMVGIIDKGATVEYIVQCPKDDTSKLEEAIKTTKILNHPKFEFSFTTKHVMELVNRVTEEWNVRLNCSITTETYLLNRNTPFHVELPPDFTFKNLTLDNVELVNSVWPHKHSTSEQFFELMTKAKLGYGLFYNKELIAWVFLKEMGALGHLYTLEKHRRKGYGELVLKLISNILMEQGKTVFAFCVVGNTRASNMYIKLGFDSIQDVDWVEFVRK